MITSVRMVNFKNIADETLKVGPFTVIVGANASGKSNIRDAFRFLHGIGRGYTLAEILGGKYGPGGQLEWAGIRGAPGEVVRFASTPPEESPIFSLYIELEMSRGKAFYSISVGFNSEGSDGFRVLHEELKTESEVVYKTIKIEGSRIRVLTGETGEKQIDISYSQPALKYFYQDSRVEHPLVFDRELYSALDGIRFIEPSTERMREPSFPGATVLGDSGENLPSVLEAICADSQRGRKLMSWLQELTPMDVKDFDFPRDPSGRIHLHIVERNGREVSAYSASDGTLRFLGILAALLGPNEGGLYFFEEIDNGIHPQPALAAPRPH